MGLKSGSRDAGLDAEDDDGETECDESAGDPAGDADRTDTPVTTDPSEQASPSDADEHSSRPSLQSIPYKLRREKVNEGREQVPYFLRPEVVNAEDELQSELEEMLGEAVYKSDYREAAMVVAQRRPELVAAVLREWGYDLDT